MGNKDIEKDTRRIWKKSNKTKVEEVLRGSITSTGCIRRSSCHGMVLFSPLYGGWAGNGCIARTSIRPRKLGLRKIENENGLGETARAIEELAGFLGGRGGFGN